MRLLRRLIVLLLVLSSGLAAQETSVDAAWNALGNNNQRLAEELFFKALQQNQDAARAHLGLSYLYELQDKHKEAWDEFCKVRVLEPEFEAFLYASALTPKIALNYENGVPDLFKDVISKADGNGLLQASLSQMVGKYLLEHNQLPEAKKYFGLAEPIDQWLLIGPFENVSASGHERAYEPENEFKPEKVYVGKNGVSAAWFEVSQMRHDKWVDFTRYFAHANAVFYGNAFVHSDRNRTVQLRVGTSGSLKAFLNDELLLESVDENNNDLDTYIAETELQPGWNRILIKVGYSEISQCNFLVRLTDTGGRSLPDLKVSVAKQEYRSKPDAPVKLVRNFAERYFEQRVAENPSHFENYLLLADCYLRNDKAIEAELVLKTALDRSPNNALLHTHLIEAYLRAEKYDEINSTWERLSDLDPSIPAVIEYQFARALQNQNLEQAEEWLRRFAQIRPESEKAYEFRIQLYGQKNVTEKIIETTQAACEKFPDNLEFAQAQAILSSYTTKNFSHAIEIMAGFLQKRTTVDVFTTLAEFYLKASDVAKWQETYTRLLEFYPASTGLYFQMANTFIALQDYSSAREYLEKAIALCPNSSAYWSTLGEVYRATDKPEEAKSAYNKALDFGPTDYDAREKLRNLEGKRPVFENFSFVDIDSLVRSAPTAEDYPDDGAVILLNDAKRVVYERGASESTEEVLVRVFNSDGIQDFNEYWIGYNPYTEDVVFEKGVVIKSDGSEVPADENNGHLVFKSLEKGDFIYIKWRIRSHYSGKLSHHFWDEHDFNGFYPMRSVRYAILTPKNTTFQTRGQYMADKPSLTRDTDDGRLMLWEASNEPAMVYEYYMPGLEDVGKRLYVSSVSNWEYMVDWYLDLAHTKTRSTYEVKEVVQRLLADKENLTEEDKIKAIYDYVTDAIHYSSVSFRQSGLIPQRARDVLVNRIGDCKDKAALAISMFREIGMEAYYVLLNTKDEGLNKHVLPSIAFNHAIVGLRTSRGTQYLDLTAQNFPLGTIPDGDRGAFALEVRPGTKKPFHLSSDNLLKSRVTRESDIEIDNNLRMLARKKVSRSGAVSAHMRDAYRFKGEKERLQRFTEVLVQDFPNVKVTHLQFDDMDALTPDQVYEYEFEVPEYANDAGGFMILQLPWSDKLEPTKALSYEKRVYPYNYWPSADTLKETLRVTLPEGSEVLEIAEPVSYSCSVADYSMKMLLEDGVLVCERVEVNKKAVVGPEEYEEFRAFYNKVIKADEKQILVKRGQLSAK